MLLNITGLSVEDVTCTSCESSTSESRSRTTVRLLVSSMAQLMVADALLPDENTTGEDMVT